MLFYLLFLVILVVILITYMASYGTKIVHLMHTQGARVVFQRAPPVIKVSIFSLPEIDFKKALIILPKISSHHVISRRNFSKEYLADFHNFRFRCAYSKVVKLLQA